MKTEIGKDENGDILIRVAYGRKSALAKIPSPTTPAIVRRVVRQMRKAIKRETGT